MNADVEALVRRLHPTIGRLVRLCINARLPVSLDAEFDHRCQGQLIVNDPDSLKAATLTLEAFGSDVTELAVVEDWGVHIFLHFADETKAGQALAYYNAMPKRMASFTSERAVKLLARVKRTVT